MKRTIKLALLACLILLVSALTLTACNNNVLANNPNTQPSGNSQTPPSDNKQTTPNNVQQSPPSVDTQTTPSVGEQTTPNGGGANSSTTPPKYSATDIYNQAVNYVGEIVTYDKSGSELSLGTCFVYSSDGKIITNYHVIEGAYSASVDINGKTYSVKTVLAYDANIDLAVLKINATNIVSAPISNRQAQVGEMVVAIGSSRGLTNTLSQGIVTYANRIVDNVAHVQHDASITHGNSGGPLINEYGEVIGINTWGVSDSQNLNFAVSVSELGNLVYGTPIPLQDLFQEQLTPYEILLNWLIDNQTSASDVRIAYNFWEGDIMYTLAYSIDGDYMYISMYDANAFTLLDLSYDPSRYAYYWDWELEYPTDHYRVTGTINAYTYNQETKLTNYNYTSGLYLAESKVVPLAQQSIYITVLALENLLLVNTEIGLTIEDFGFLNYR